jgi:hypothetical protein
MTNTQKQMKVNTIDINAKEWFDKVNGNSYFAANVTLNFGQPDKINIVLPFQYGYGDSYQYEAMKVLNEQNYINVKYLHELRDNKIIVRYNIQRNCKQRELKNI